LWQLPEIVPESSATKGLGLCGTRFVVPVWGGEATILDVTPLQQDLQEKCWCDTVFS
jgi:hypothetical protein